MRLPDGRMPGCAEYGDQGGMALINCHGGLTSRLDIRSCDAVACGRVRVISPGRPGVGLSHRKPGRTRDWQRGRRS